MPATVTSMNQAQLSAALSDLESALNYLASMARFPEVR